MALQVLVDGQDYTKYVDLPTIQIESNIAVTNDTATLNIIIPQQVVPRPKGGQEIQVINGDVIEFGGVILTPEEDTLATDVLLYQVQCQDYKFYFDKHTVTDTFSDMSTGEIVKAVVENYTTGFTTNNVQGTGNSFVISSIIFDHKAPSDVIKKLADDTSFQWWIDYNKDVHFGPTSTVQSPLPDNTLDVDNSLTAYSQLQITEDVSQLRNQIYLLGFKLPADYSITQNFSLDGQRNTLGLQYEPKHDLKSITVDVNGDVYSNKLDVSGGLPNNTAADETAYINYSQQSVRFNAAPPSGVASVTYVPMFEIVKMYNDPNAISEMKARDLQDGIYEYAVRDQQLTSTDSTLADMRGQLELYKYAYPHVSGQFNSFLQGWQPGQYFTFKSKRRMDGELDGETLFVVKVEKVVVSHPANGAPTIQYTVYFSDTPYVL